MFYLLSLIHPATMKINYHTPHKSTKEKVCIKNLYSHYIFIIININFYKHVLTILTNINLPSNDERGPIFVT